MTHTRRIHSAIAPLVLGFVGCALALATPVASAAANPLTGIGGKLAYISQSGDLTILDGSTGSTRVLVRPGSDTFWNPRWSPDGKSIAFFHNSPTNADCGCGGLTSYLAIVPADGSEPPRRVTNDQTSMDSLDWFPNSQVLAYSYGGNGNFQAARVNVDGQFDLGLYDGSQTSTYMHPSVSPDGQFIAVNVGAYSDQSAVYVSAADGSNSSDLVDLGANGQLTVAGSVSDSDTVLTWMPDSSGVVYGTGTGVLLAPLDGMPPSQLIAAPGPVDAGSTVAVSADGTRIALVFNPTSPVSYGAPWSLGIGQVGGSQLMTFGNVYPGGRSQWVAGQTALLYVAGADQQRDPGILRLVSMSSGTATDVVSLSNNRGAASAFDWHS